MVSKIIYYSLLVLILNGLWVTSNPLPRDEPVKTKTKAKYEVVTILPGQVLNTEKSMPYQSVPTTNIRNNRIPTRTAKPTPPITTTTTTTTAATTTTKRKESGGWLGHFFEYEFEYPSEQDQQTEVVVTPKKYKATTKQPLALGCPETNSACHYYCEKQRYYSGYCEGDVCACFGPL